MFALAASANAWRYCSNNCLLRLLNSEIRSCLLFKCLAIKSIFYTTCDCLFVYFYREGIKFGHGLDIRCLDTSNRIGFHKLVDVNTLIVPHIRRKSRTPEQRCTNKNANDLIRDYFPKRIHIDNDIENNDVIFCQYQLNWRQRKTLNYKIPSEIFFGVGRCVWFDHMSCKTNWKHTNVNRFDG